MTPSQTTFQADVSPANGFDMSLGVPSYDQLVHCMRCGLCLPTCPTYSIYRDEKASPRGRLALMRAVVEGRLQLADGFEEAMNLCLGCLACQTACPAGVPYGSLLERAREQAEGRHRPRRLHIIAAFRSLLISSLVNTPSLVDRLAPLLRIYQTLGLGRLNLARFLPGPIGGWERMLPVVPKQSAQRRLGRTIAAVPPVRGKVGLVTGCIENSLLANIPISTAKLLALNGFDVAIPPSQVCCGALPGHLGEIDLARKLARRNIDAFEAEGIEFVISDAAGCSMQLKEYGLLLADDPVYSKRARHFASRACDATEFLASILPLRGMPRSFPMKVAFADPCHLIHGQGIHTQPRQLLETIPGVELVELPESNWCCGSAGTYNLTHVTESEKLLRRKMAHVRSIAPDVLATANTGCMVQLVKGVRESKVDAKLMHIVEIVASAYDSSS